MSMENINQLLVIVYSCIFFTGVTANATVLYSLKKIWKPGQRGHFYFLHLSIANIVALFLNIGISVAWNATEWWATNDVVCKTVAFCLYLGSFLANNTVAAFGVDGAVGIITKSEGRRRRNVLQVIAWLLSVLASSPFPYIYSVVTIPSDTGLKICGPYNALHTQTDRRQFAWTLTSVLYFLPAVCVIVGNGIAVALWTARRSPPVAEKPEGNTNITADRRVWLLELYVSIALGIIFLVCWTPLMSYQMGMAEQSFEFHPTLSFALFVFILLSFCFTPVVYCIYWAILKKCGTHGLEPKPVSNITEK